MTPPTLLVLLALGIVAPALLGPRLIQAAAPALVRIPRLAIAMLVGALAAWLVSLFAAGPILAWITTGPTLLGGSTAETCQRCLAASNPFGDVPAIITVPASVLLAVPALGAIALVSAGLRRTRRRRDQSRDLGRVIAETARVRVIAGHRVNVITDGRPMAFTLPSRHGGIVISSGALEVLDEYEIAAVIAHEDGHLRQRHHALTTLVDAIAAPLRKVPLIRAVIESLPHYLEIAADEAARSRAGTAALASALVTLSGVVPDAADRSAIGLAAPALHATGPDRIRHLVTPSGTAAPTAWMATGVGVVGTIVLFVAGVAVHAPYLAAAVAGCP